MINFANKMNGLLFRGSLSRGDGFATSQQAYEDAYHKLFAALDWVEQTLTQQRYMAGAILTEPAIPSMASVMACPQGPA